MTFDAIVLVGGAGRRLGGVDKAALLVGGIRLLDRVLDACAGARETVVVGVARPTARPVRWTVEQPPGGGPLTGLAAGLSALPSGSDRVVVLATDLPYFTSHDVTQLVSTSIGRDAAVYVDAERQLQPLCAAYSVPALRVAVAAAGDVRGAPLHSILGHLRYVTLFDEGASHDVDTPQDLAEADGRLAGTE